MLYMEIIAVCFQICTNVKYMLGQNSEFFNVKHGGT
jgi:hypothetical protein